MKTAVMNRILSLDVIIQLIKQKEKIEKIVDMVTDNPSAITEIISALQTEKTSIKFSYEKILRLISEKNPDLLYPHFKYFVKLLDSENNFLKWGSIITIANLTSVDDENKFDKVF